MGFALKTSCFLVFLLVGSATAAFSENKLCPFNFLFHFGDGVFDNGNSIRIKPFGPRLPAARLPYGKTNPGYPTGRWSDGLLDIDVGAIAMGFPELTPYLGGNASNNNAIIFAVARSPILDRVFFTKRGVKLEAFASPLSTQMSWFRQYLSTICSTPTECADRLADSLYLLGDVEGNDVTIPLVQGKSIEEVKGYVPYVTEAQINAAREVIQMGGARVIIPGNNPMGCYPFILTKFKSNSLDEYGCAKEVNELIQYKNKHLQAAIKNLSSEFPDTMIFYADFYTGFEKLLQEVRASTHKRNILTTCCGYSGIGNKYNYLDGAFCGSKWTRTCSDPSSYIFWDGIHLTHFANNRLSEILQVGAMETLNCTVSKSTTTFNPILEVTDGKIKSSPKLIRM